MDFIDEQNNVAASLNFFQNFLQALFKITAIAAAGNKRTQVKCVQLFVGQSFWNLIRDNFLSEAFNNCGLTNTRFTDQNGVVFRATRKNLHHTFHFFVSTNYWIKFFVARKLCQVATELIKNLTATFFLWRIFRTNCFAFTFAARSLVAAQQLNYLLTYSTKIGAKFDEHLCCNTFAFANQTEQNVFGTDVVMTKLQCLTQRKFEHFFRPWCKWNMARWRRSALTDDLFNLRAHGFKRDTECFESFGGHAFTFVNQTQQNVFRTDVRVIEQAGFFLGENYDSASPICKPFEQFRPPCASTR